MKTILFGLDGATYTVLDPLMEEGVMPHLRSFVQNGFRAKLISTATPLTPVAWTSMITGCQPGRHGVFDFIYPVESDSRIYFNLSDSRDIRCDTIWTMLTKQGLNSASLNFPVTFPPQPLSGCMIAGFVTGRHMRRAVYPLEFYEEIKRLPGFNIKELAWDMDMEKKAIQFMPIEEYEPWIEFHLRRQQQWATVLKHVMAKRDCDLITFIDDGPDKIQHLAWRFLSPEGFSTHSSRRERRVRDLCLAYFRQVDELLKEVMTLAGADSRIFIASDHGFCGTQQIFYINTWLQQHGYLVWREASLVTDSEDIAAQRMKTQYEMLDWERTVAYSPTPSCSGVYIRQARAPGEPGIPPEKYEGLRRKLIGELLAFTDPESGRPIVRKVLTREEAFAGEQMHKAPDLIVELYDHGFPSVLNAGTQLKARTNVAGTHHPDGIFIAGGKGIRKTSRSGVFAIPDVCPALLYSVGAEIPSGLDGRLHEMIFEPHELKRNPPRYMRGNVARAAAVAGSPVPSNDAGNEELLERLKILGYIE